MDKTQQAIVILIAVVLVGSIAGIMQMYSHTIMRGLGSTDDRTFVSAFQSIDKAIINPFFMMTFFGGLFLTGASAFMLYRGDGTQSIAKWAIAAFLLYLITVIITMAINVPLNDAIKAAGNPDKIKDLSKTRELFNESGWLFWNHIRTALTTTSFALMTWCLYLLGKV